VLLQDPYDQQHYDAFWAESVSHAARGKELSSVLSCFNPTVSPAH
jgi:hypothetical protein